MKQRIRPFLWFNDNAEEAVNFYVANFPDSKILDIKRYGKEMPFPEGTVMTMEFEVAGLQFIALNGGPHFEMTPGTSFLLTCETQEELDRLWDIVADGGSPMQCGWITDRFGVTWQIVPKVLMELLGDPDPDRVHRVTHLILSMVKLDGNLLLQA